MPRNETPRRSYWILEDQLSLDHPVFQQNRNEVVLLFIESRARATRLRYHKKRLVLFFSAQRHFAQERESEGWHVDYHEMAETSDALVALRTHLAKASPEALHVVEPSNYQDWTALPRLEKTLGCRLEVMENPFFLVSREEFTQWARGKKRLLMEAHYRRLREKLGLLLEEDGQPVGGQWNYDAENRKTFKDWQKQGRPQPPVEPECNPDAITRAVQNDVEEFFGGHPGTTDGFAEPVTRARALQRLEFFLEHRLGSFGDFQDTMVEGSPTLFHSFISPALNLGLLSPLECARAAEAIWRQGRAPLAAVEAFIRQIIGWREFVRGVYCLRMPEYAGLNELGANRPLPPFFYNGETRLNCLRQSLEQVLQTGYNHHIQRLMILGNFCLLAGIEPGAVLRWFNEMYLDAHDWVMAANVLGMALHADGGYMATKPYAGGGAYISRMSNYCAGCAYDPRQKSGPGACPFNLLYWNFYEQHGARFGRNPRTAMMVRSWLKRPAAERETIVREAEEFLDSFATVS